MESSNLKCRLDLALGGGAVWTTGTIGSNFSTNNGLDFRFRLRCRLALTGTCVGASDVAAPKAIAACCVTDCSFGVDDEISCFSRFGADDRVNPGEERPLVPVPGVHSVVE